VAIAEPAPVPARKLEREAGFPSTAGADERHDAHIRPKQ